MNLAALLRDGLDRKQWTVIVTGQGSGTKRAGCGKSNRWVDEVLREP